MDTSASPPRPTSLWLARRGVALALARVRFFLLVGGVLLLVGYWPTVRNVWERLTRPDPLANAVSSNTEYWCPMCPGVVSDWPSKCPVCHMTLVRRQKGDMTPLPDGVVARVQLSPYRLQLAGIRTTAVDYHPLNRDVAAAGLLETGSPGRWTFAAEVFAQDAVFLSPGRQAEVVCDACPGQRFPARVVEFIDRGRGQRIRVEVEDAAGKLRPGLYATAVVRVPASETETDAVVQRWRDQTAVEVMASGGEPAAGLAAMLQAAVGTALLKRGLVAAVPESAVIDTGTRQVVFVETMPGMFDAVEVQLGRRCGDYYPLRAGLEPGQRVVTAGAVLLDAETRLNPNVAASYFGAGSRSGAAPPPQPGTLSPEDQLLAQRQKVCPVTKAPLDSMGGPVRVTVNGKPVFICCDGCRGPLLKNPDKYLSRLSP